jgi:hypothetical protein
VNETTKSASAKRFTFRIGDAFPADDPVARFVAVLAIVSNDLLRMLEQMIEGERAREADRDPTRVQLFRRMISSLFEANKILVNTPRMFSEVGRFMDELDPDAQQDLEIVRGSFVAGSDHSLGSWPAVVRNTTHHYFELHPERAQGGKEEAKIALEKAADLQSGIFMDEHFGSVRFDFADELLVQLLPDIDDESAFEKSRDATLALTRFVQRAIGHYMAGMPEGTFVEAPCPAGGE